MTSEPTALVAPAGGAAEPSGLLEVFFQSGPMAQFVLGVLLLFSVLSWAVMIAKWFQFGRAERQGERFLDVFRKSRRFSEVAAVTARLGASPLVGIFQTGHAEIDAQVKQSGAEAEGRYKIRSMGALERSLHRAVHVELQAFRRWTPLLATTAAATPFIGLFGTVWGIMVAFHDIGLTGSTSLTVVAPGIAEALVNTAAGLAAAIPALVGYNYFAARLRRLREKMDDFALEMLNLAERNFT
jgi:biopolymer transport protein TolQ